MQRKPSWAPLFGLVFLIAALVALAYFLGLRGLAERRLIDAGLALVAVLAFAWPSVIRRGLLLEGADRAGAYSMRVHEPKPIAWFPEAAGERSEALEAAEQR